jgi:DNA polymerase (family 10)
MKKSEIAAVLTEIGTLMELKGENPFKTRAYQTGARIVESLGEDELKERIAAGTLQEVKGIGEALAQKITELQTTGRLEFFEKLKASVPPGLVEILAIPGIGPKKVRALQEKLGVDSVAKLRAACAENRVAALEGFGEKTQERILAGIRNREAYNKRHLWIEAKEASDVILAGLRKQPGVQQVEACGSLRRRLETVGDIDFLVATTEPAPIVEWFVTQAGIKEITARGETKASVRLESGLQADLRLVPPEQFVFTLHHLTGSKDHNVQMRHRALQRGLSMSEWGLFPADEKHGPSAGTKAESGKLKAEGKGSISVKSEEELFRALGLHFIPPELREGMGEIEAAETAAEKAESGKLKPENSEPPQVSGLKSQVSASSPQVSGLRSQVSGQPGRGLPRLLEEGDIRGVFHNHTTASDGHNTLEEMVAAAQALGLDYLGIADHSKSSVQARGLSEERLTAQIAEIGKLNASKKFKCHVFTGTECDILPDGKLDFDRGLLAQLDYTVVSIHSSFRQERDVMTKRIIRAIEQPHVTMLGHLTGRLLLEREGYEVDVDRVIDAAIANGVAIEINANPWRLDMDWRHWKKAAEKGLLTSINPDAHRTTQLEFYKLGVGIARKGWLGKESVLNARSLPDIKKYLAGRR